MTLRERCKAFLQQHQINGILRQGDPVQDLVDFIHAETGRTANPQLEESAPLVFYPRNEKDREELIAAFRDAFPGAVMKKMP